MDNLNIKLKNQLKEHFNITTNETGNKLFCKNKSQNKTHVIDIFEGKECVQLF